ncbi:MAG: hypothetical protein ACK44W_04330 [Planctomycetota bacterium]
MPSRLHAPLPEVPVNGVAVTVGRPSAGFQARPWIPAPGATGSDAGGSIPVFSRSSLEKRRLPAFQALAGIRDDVPPLEENLQERIHDGVFVEQGLGAEALLPSPLEKAGSMIGRDLGNAGDLFEREKQPKLALRALLA